MRRDRSMIYVTFLIAVLGGWLVFGSEATGRIVPARINLTGLTSIAGNAPADDDSATDRTLDSFVVASFDYVVGVASIVNDAGTDNFTLTGKWRVKNGGTQGVIQTTATSSGTETLSDWTLTKSCLGTQTFDFEIDVEGMYDLELTAALANGAAADSITIELVGIREGD